MPVAIRFQIHTSVCGNPHDGYSILGNPRHTFERGTWQETEFQFPLFKFKAVLAKVSYKDAQISLII
jgi:hypothetical protein